MCLDLVQSMIAFQSFCQSHLDPKRLRGFRGKLAVLHGETATRCPSWHADNVPVRFLQTMCGPGTMYVDSTEYPPEKVQAVLQRIALRQSPPNWRKNNDHDVNSGDWKDELLKESGIEASQAKLGQGMMFVGYRWQESLKGKHQSKDILPPVVHRSPRNIPTDQPRVILTMDVEMASTHDGREKWCSKNCCDPFRRRRRS